MMSRGEKFRRWFLDDFGRYLVEQWWGWGAFIIFVVFNDKWRLFS
jgi:hypothetical protein